ncbi:MAG: aminotransferase class V-fold PLP-dependent enzyme [Planctomycetes bacterium]|nr:aminotransferase class V-fold PLP-dependent enzyme [Planctomycetota bacterium]
MIYLDNAATSWPKPDAVHEAVSHSLREVGANPGRSGHRLANEAERVRFDTREALAELLGVKNPMRVVFTSNATTALNLVIAGLLTPGTHVVTTGMEHNAVMRPLRALEQHGVSVSIIPCDPDGSLDPRALDEHMRPETRLIVANHASNVCGTILPIRDIGVVARRHRIPFLVDTAQTAGCRPIDLIADNIDLLAFSGHKGLLGPTGIGGLAIDDDFDVDTLPPLIRGGTGSRSEHEHQPDFLPDKYEAGTPNLIGMAGLRAGVRYVLDRGVDEIGTHERLLTQRLIDGLREIAGVQVFGTHDANRQTAVVSFTIDGQSASDIAHALDEEYEIMCRPGLHCAPRAHQTLGTLPDGTIRFAPGPFSTEAEIVQAIDAVARLAEGGVE